MQIYEKKEKNHKLEMQNRNCNFLYKMLVTNVLFTIKIKQQCIEYNYNKM